MVGEDEMDERRVPDGGRQEAEKPERPEPPGGSVLFERLGGIRERTLADVARSSRRRELPRFIAGGAIALAVVAVAVALVVGALLRAPGGTSLPADGPTASSTPAPVATANAILQGVTLPAGAFSIDGSPMSVLGRPLGWNLTARCSEAQSFTRFWAGGAGNTDGAMAFLKAHVPEGFTASANSSQQQDGSGVRVDQIEFTSPRMLPLRGAASTQPFEQLDFSVAYSSDWGDVIRLDATVLPQGYVCEPTSSMPDVRGRPLPVPTPDPSDAPIPMAAVDDPDAASAPAHAQQLLDSVMLPAGVTPVAEEPSPDFDMWQQGAGALWKCTPLAVKKSYWTVSASSVQQLTDFFRTHAPDGFSAGMTFGLGNTKTHVSLKGVEETAGYWPTSTAPGHDGANPQSAYDQIDVVVEALSTGDYGLMIAVQSLPDGGNCEDRPITGRGLSAPIPTSTKP